MLLRPSLTGVLPALDTCRLYSHLWGFIPAIPSTRNTLPADPTLSLSLRAIFQKGFPIHPIRNACHLPPTRLTSRSTSQIFLHHTYHFLTCYIIYSSHFLSPGTGMGYMGRDFCFLFFFPSFSCITSAWGSAQHTISNGWQNRAFSLNPSLYLYPLPYYLVMSSRHGLGDLCCPVF